MKLDFIPHDDDGQKDWLQNFKNEVEAIAPVAGANPAQATEVKTDCESLITKIDAVKLKKSELKTAANDKNVLRKTTLEKVRKLVKQIKASPNYTVAMGNTLRIIGTDTAIDLSTLVVDFTLIALGNGQVRIEFTKPGGIDGVNIYSRTAGTANWVYVARDNYSPYVDTRPPVSTAGPETREYALRPVIHDEEVGILSPIQSVVVL